LSPAQPELPQLSAAALRVARRCRSQRRESSDLLLLQRRRGAHLGLSGTVCRTPVTRPAHLAPAAPELPHRRGSRCAVASVLRRRISPMTDAAARSRKDLSSTGLAMAYQREFAKTLQKRVVEDREPFAIAQADTAHEIFHTLDIPVLTNQWWAAYLSAKQLSGHYLRVLQDHGYPDNSCRYCTL